MQYKVVSYEYFMDDITEYELELLAKNLAYADKSSWEMSRMIMYASLLPYFKSGQHKTPQEILPLATDNDTKQQTTSLTNEEFNAMNERALAMEQFFAKNINSDNNGEQC